MDDFNDGNYDGWNVTACSVVDGTLRATGAPAYASHNSDVAAGTWSFDMEHLPWSESTRPSGQLGLYMFNSIFYFMGNAIEDFPRSSYCLVAGYSVTDDDWEPVYSIRKSLGVGGDIGAWPLLGSWDGQELGWQHFDITRTAEGRISVFHNGTLVVQVVDTDINSSEYFIFLSYDDRALDNVVVSDTIDHHSGLPLYLLALGVGATSVFLSIPLWMKKRNREPGPLSRLRWNGEGLEESGRFVRSSASIWAREET